MGRGVTWPQVQIGFNDMGRGAHKPRKGSVKLQGSLGSEAFQRVNSIPATNSLQMSLSHVWIHSKWELDLEKNGDDEENDEKKAN